MFTNVFVDSRGLVPLNHNRQIKGELKVSGAVCVKMCVCECDGTEASRGCDLQ